MNMATVYLPSPNNESFSVNEKNETEVFTIIALHVKDFILLC